MYFKRAIDIKLREWADSSTRKPILLRGARQVGKSTVVDNLGKSFESFVKINFERQPEYNTVFSSNLDVRRIVSQLAAISGKPIEEGTTLLFFDEIQMCPEAIMSLRFFKEELPGLHVIAAGSLLEFALEELPTFGVGRIHSMFMYPMTFDEFLNANGEELLIKARNEASSETPLPEPLHEKLVSLFRTYILVGGMPEVVASWVANHDYLHCQELQDDIIVSYEDDFSKYKKKVDPNLLRATLSSVAFQTGKKFTYSEVGGGYRTNDIKKALDMLMLAGLCMPVTRTDANGVPLGSQADETYRKFLIFDSGIMLRILKMTLGNITELTTEILTENTANLVNRGQLAELIAGLELLRYQSPNIRSDLYYWTRLAKNAQAEIDYIIPFERKILPIEVKAGTKGGMKSLWIFMREKHIENAIRCSLENFGSFDYTDEEDHNAIRKVSICPLYAISMLSGIAKDFIEN